MLFYFKFRWFNPFNILGKCAYSLTFFSLRLSINLLALYRSTRTLSSIDLLFHVCIYVHSHVIYTFFPFSTFLCSRPSLKSLYLFFIFIIFLVIFICFVGHVPSLYCLREYINLNLQIWTCFSPAAVARNIFIVIRWTIWISLWSIYSCFITIWYSQIQWFRIYLQCKFITHLSK